MGRTRKITDEEILTAARQVFLDQGVGGSTAEIAQLAGISEASIFKRFSTKQDLFMAAIGIDKIPNWVKKLEQDTPSSDFKAELTEICEAMLAFYQDVLPRVLMLLSPAVLLRTKQFVPPPLRDSHLMAIFLERAIEQGYIRKCDARTIAYMIVGGINNYVISQSLLIKLLAASELPKQKPLKPSEFIDNLIETLWAAISQED
jgi:AcrR family transcriptional regulator